MERPFIIHTLRKLQRPLPSQQQVWGCPAGSISQWDWMCASVMPWGWVGQGAGASCCPKAGMWLYTLIPCTATLKKVLAGEAGISGVPKDLEPWLTWNPLCPHWYDQCWPTAHRVGSKTVPYTDTVSLSAGTSGCVLVPSASQHNFNKSDS